MSTQEQEEARRLVAAIETARVDAETQADMNTQARVLKKEEQFMARRRQPVWNRIPKMLLEAHSVLDDALWQQAEAEVARLEASSIVEHIEGIRQHHEQLVGDTYQRLARRHNRNEYR